MRDLTRYRLETAQEHVAAAEFMLNCGHYKSAVVSSFFAMFNAMRALLAEEMYERKNFLSSVRHFRRRYIDANLLDKNCSGYFNAAFKNRKACDYEDFVVVSKEEATEQYEHAAEFCEAVKKFLEDRQ